ncbi:hypothetical protein [Sorangium sp. So ce1099]|uniref:hypothetical protein n=1 Tax=Sorangium sp. So ce1099 TaxID=3133331 RepID=UPI003F64193C
MVSARLMSVLGAFVTTVGALGCVGDPALPGGESTTTDADPGADVDAFPGAIELAMPELDVDGATAPMDDALSDGILNSHDPINMGWDAWGYEVDMITGHHCEGGWTRSYAEAERVEGRGVCFVVDWLNDSPYDCRVVVRLREKARKSGTCHVFVYRWGETAE